MTRQSRQPITLIKLGGSIITHKEVPMMVREEVLRRLLKEIARAQKVTNAIYIIGHGQGSFAHAPALRYQTMNGFINGESRMGMAITQDSAAKLNRIVVETALAEELPAVSFALSNSMVTENKKPAHWCGNILTAYLDKQMVPITFGDVLVDEAQGCTIWSTETIFSFLVEWLETHPKYDVDRVIHVSEVAGVLDSVGEIIPVITPSNQAEVKKSITTTKGFDVTGGMWHKIAESLSLTKYGLTTAILSGVKPNNLYNALVGQDWIGTQITAD